MRRIKVFPTKTKLLIASILLMQILLVALAIVIRPLSAESAQRRSAEVAYGKGSLTVYCESPNGNEVYVVSTASGAGVSVVPGGCK